MSRAPDAAPGFEAEDGRPAQPEASLAALERRIDYDFTNPGLKIQALTHRSHRNENQAVEHNERLEFLGDAVLGFLIGRMLYHAFPRKTEGQLTRLRSALVSDFHLAGKARALELGSYLHLGRGEALNGGRDKDSILADAYESLLGAVYLDGGLGAVSRLVEAEFGREVERLGERPPAQDFKTRLKERLEAAGCAEPSYEVLETVGPDHSKCFHVAVFLDGRDAGRGVGASKKAAEQRAARAAVEALEAEEAAEVATVEQSPAAPG